MSHPGPAHPGPHQVPDARERGGLPLPAPASAALLPAGVVGQALAARPLPSLPCSAAAECPGSTSPCLHPAAFSLFLPSEHALSFVPVKQSFYIIQLIRMHFHSLFQGREREISSQSNLNAVEGFLERKSMGFCWVCDGNKLLLHVNNLSVSLC